MQVIAARRPRRRCRWSTCAACRRAAREARGAAAGRGGGAAAVRPRARARCCGPLLLRLGEREHVLLLTMHHIVTDGWSMGVLVRELAALYAAFAAGRPSPLPELPVQYADFAAWQRSWLQRRGAGAAARLLARAAGRGAAAAGAADRPAAPGGAELPRRRASGCALPPELDAALEALGRREGATLFMMLLAAFQALLRRYTGAGATSWSARRSPAATGPRSRG